MKVIRSQHATAKWIYSPHELAKAYAGWRCFRHLTYNGIRSFLLADGSRLWAFGKHYRDQLDDSLDLSEAQWIHRYHQMLRREGLFNYRRRAIEWRFVQITSWEESPLCSTYRNRIPFRLGTSCVLCGKIQRGDDALTERRRAVEWLGFDYLHGAWVPTSLLRGRRNVPWLVPNPLCPECWKAWGGVPLPVSKIILRAAAKQIRKEMAA